MSAYVELAAGISMLLTAASLLEYYIVPKIDEWDTPGTVPRAIKAMILALLLWCLGAELMAGSIPVTQLIGGTRAPPGATRCEVTFSMRTCPAQPSWAEADERNTFHDNYEGSGSNAAMCMSRARAFYEWCKFDGQPVTARFYIGDQESLSSTWPR